MSVEAPVGRRKAKLALAALVLAAATACSGGSGGGGWLGGSGDGGTTGSRTPSAPPAAVAMTPKAGSTNLSPVTPVTVRASDGTLDSVRLVNETGKVVQGALSADRTRWRTAEVLGYSRTYTLSAVATNPDGKQTNATSTFSTVTPDNFTMPSFGVLEGGGTFGVGMPVTLHFDEPIPDKAVAEKSLTVTTTPKVAGSWYWIDDQNVHYRPQKYWTAGTKVSVQAKVYGVNMGDGLYGQADKSVSFTIGRSQVAVINNDAHMMTVYLSGRKVRSIPVSMGRGGTIRVNGRTIDFRAAGGLPAGVQGEDPARHPGLRRR